MRGTSRLEGTRGVLAAAVLILPLFLAACAEAAPDLADFDRPQATYYTVIVRPGDTVAAIAQRYRVTPSVVARLNEVAPDDELRAGDTLRVPAVSARTRHAVLAEAVAGDAPNYAPPPKTFSGYEPRSHSSVAVRELAPLHVTPAPDDTAVEEAPVVMAPPAVERSVAEQEDVKPAVTISHGRFAWPLSGPVILPYGSDDSGARNDGINIAATLGTPIHAAAAGTVTYAGNELKGYGNLILITHDGGYVTAYAHAQSIDVSRGDHVDKGQVIATAGKTGDVSRPQLHFEIRRGVQPVNPKLLLASR
ncbi:MAG TPA: M23 family metallopeptidase [Rhizomicrobium sp.]|jgi:murein DD-endopeptidase MepM/ murein hydrolase activator NlpD